MIKKNTIFFDGRKIGTYKYVLTAGIGHIYFNEFEPCEPQLNENQQIVLEWLKLHYDGDDVHEAMWNIFMMYYYHTRDSFTERLSQAIENLTNDEQIEILQKYYQWTLE